MVLRICSECTCFPICSVFQTLSFGKHKRNSKICIVCMQLPISVLYRIIMRRTVINVVRTCGPTHLSVLFGNKICLN